MAKKKAASTATVAPAVPLKLSGKSVCLAGNFYYLLEPIHKVVASEGGTLVDDLTEQTDYLIVGHSAIANPKKKAEKLNAKGATITILAIDQFNQLLALASDEAVDMLRAGAAGVERWNRLCALQQFYGHNPLTSIRSNQPALIRDANFTNLDLSNANLSLGCERCDFTGANLAGASLFLTNCTLNGAKVDGVTWLHLINCSAEQVDFRNIRADHAFLNSCQLTGSIFSNVAAKKLHFNDCQLNDADCSNLSAPRPSITRCSLAGSNFRGANLEEADLSNSDWSGADLSGANLNLAGLTGCKFIGTNLAGATMLGAEVDRVDFSQAKAFDVSQIQGKILAGSAVQAFLQAIAKAHSVTTTLTVTRGAKTATLSANFLQHYAFVADDDGNHYHMGHGTAQTTPGALWATLATKWNGATPDLGSLTIRSTKSPVPNKELKQLALNAWCEIFKVAAPTQDELKELASASKSAKQENATQWFDILRSGADGVQQWNASAGSLSKQLNKLTEVDLSGVSLTGITLQKMEWKNPNFSDADLSNAQIEYCKFTHANFAGARLSGVKTRGSFFPDASFAGADCSSADLSGASFKRADCTKANFTKANLRNTDLCGADLTDANVSEAILAGSSYDEHSRWPADFKPTLEMLWKGPGTSPAAHASVQASKPKGKIDVDQFMTRLEELTDANKRGKALSMLKADRFRLYAQVKEDHLVGVVKSQSDADLVYSCRLNSDGTYACCTQNLNVCGGLRGSLCKHLLVLIIGLTKNGEFDPNIIDTWIRLSRTNKPALDKDAMSETLLRYKGAEAGEVDWRPSETIPEDYYAM